jgi:hypothetical protein
MPTNTNTATGFPGIVASYGSPFPPGVGAGIDRYWGGGQVLFVGNRSSLPAGNGSSPASPMSSLVGTGGALAALQGTTGRGHVIFVLPGSSYSVDAADWASATGAASDFAIVGLGTGRARPTFTWTTAGSTWLLDTANVKIDNCRLFLAGPNAGGAALTVAAPITVSATGCGLINCEVAWGFDADQIVGIGITTTAAATNFSLINTDCYTEAATAAPTTTFLRLTGADFFLMDGSRIVGPGSSTTIGPVQELTTASLKKLIRRSIIQSTTASSTVCYTAIAGSGQFVDSGLIVGTGTLAVTASSAMTASSTYTFSVASGLQTLLAIT